MVNDSKTMYKYSIDDYVTYRKVGICRISDITVQNFGGQGKIEYYVLSSVYNDNTKVFVPVASELESEIKRMLTVDEIHAIIDLSKTIENDWIEDCRTRAASFEAIVNSGDKSQMLWLIRRVTAHKNEMDEAKKKMKAYDTRYLTMAESIISMDFAYALGLQKNQVIGYINDYFNK